MAPEADKLRQRNKQPPPIRGTAASTGGTDDELISNNNSDRVVTKLEHLGRHEVCIDGVIYDLTSFDHPGGESIMIFGGNDVTVQYRMIHPYHTTKHLEKMKKVGKVADYTSEYKFDTAFEKEIKREVFQIVHRGKEFATMGYLFRAISYLIAYFYLQYLWLYQDGSSLTLAVVYGVIQALIGMNVQHDANHGAVSGKYPWMNNVLGLGADLIGGSKWLWMEQHWTHHAYTNHPTKDPDALSGEPIFLWTDYPLDHPKRQWHHRFQGTYYMFILSLYWISEVFNPQVLDLRQRGAMSTGIRMESDYCVGRRKYSTALRLYYIAVHVVAPVYQHGPYGLLHSLVLGFTESLTLAILFSLSHNFEGCDRDPLHTTKRDENGQVCWFTAQVETSCTYGGALAGYLTGGLNFQIEHHLFPRMSSAWYPYIAPTVRKVCQKHGVKYTYYPWVHQNWASTFWYMCQTGTGANWRDGNPYSGKL